MFHVKRSLRLHYRKCYFFLSTFSICLIIFYCFISHKHNVMLLTFYNKTNFSNSHKNSSSSSSGGDSGNGSDSGIKTNIHQNLSKKHVVDSNKQLRDWHISTQTQQQLQVTRDHPQTSTNNRYNNQQHTRRQQQQQHHQHTTNKPQYRILSLDTSKFGQTAITNSTYDLELIENKNTIIITSNNNNSKIGSSNNKVSNNYSYKKRLQLTGFNVELSERLPMRRLIPDTRHESCKTKLYAALLPQCSVVIVYHNEHSSVLFRTIYSVLDRTPAELLKEIILVNDFSEQNKEIEEHIKRESLEKVQLMTLSQRAGLIRARLKGASMAKGEVLVFLDAHVEVNENWLPPLLAPIAEDGKTCTTPIIDIIKYDTLAYQGSMPSRGGFNWQFNYVQLPLLPEEEKLLPLPHNNPIMNGGLFAIRKDYFWSLGGYDKGLEIWGAEQFEMSFKIWLCGGRLVEVPCSRVGHLYRDPEFRVNYTNRKDDFISKNYKRVAEVWLDEYKEFLYEHIPKLTQIKAGSLKRAKFLRKHLNCRPFKWFFDNIAPDLIKAYPPVKPADFALGAIQSLALPELCIDLGSTSRRQILTDALKACSPDLKYPYAVQKFHLSFRHDLRHQDNCLEVQRRSSHTPIWLWPCHNLGGNQYWYYDRNTQMLVQGKNDYSKLCLEIDKNNLSIFASECDFTKQEQKWHFGYINQTAMEHFFDD